MGPPQLCAGAAFQLVQGGPEQPLEQRYARPSEDDIPLSHPAIGAQDASSRNRRVYQLRFDKNGADGSLMREWDDDTTELIKDTDPDAIDEASGEPDMVKSKRAQSQFAHQLLLSTLYHADIADELEWCKSVETLLEHFTNIADFYGCSGIARTRCDQILRRHFSSVLKTCGEDPVRMMAFGLAVKSDWIFKEISILIVCRRETRYAEMLERVKREIADEALISSSADGRDLDRC